MITYDFLQQYWWFLIALLGGILVFMFFVQGGNALIFLAGKNEREKELIINSTGRKWELTFTTLVTFGGAFFASFPLFYSTSFGGAYWVWVLILITFVLQAVSYEFQRKAGNILGKTTFRIFLVINGCLAPLLIGTAIGTFFTGSEFTINKTAVASINSPVISQWSNEWHGLEAVTEPFNVELGLMVMFLTICLGAMYLINNIADSTLAYRLRRCLMFCFCCFLTMFLIVITQLMTMDGFAVNADGNIYRETHKYMHNLLQMPIVLIIFLTGVLLLLTSITISLIKSSFRRGIWFGGLGSILSVMAVFMIAGYNNTSYYPSTADMQSSLTIANSCSSEFTLRVMAIVSLIIPFVVAYIAYFWHKMDKQSLTSEELNQSEKY